MCYLITLDQVCYNIIGYWVAMQKFVIGNIDITIHQSPSYFQFIYKSAESGHKWSIGTLIESTNLKWVNNVNNEYYECRPMMDIPAYLLVVKFYWPYFLISTWTGELWFYSILRAKVLAYKVKHYIHKLIIRKKAVNTYPLKI